MNWLKSKHGQQEGDAQASPIAELAISRGWDWRGDLDHDAVAELGLDFEFGADDVSVVPGQPLVVCGSNATTQYDDGLRYRRAQNFVAVRHGLELPHLMLRTSERPPMPGGG